MWAMVVMGAAAGVDGAVGVPVVRVWSVVWDVSVIRGPGSEYFRGQRGGGDEPIRLVRD